MKKVILVIGFLVFGFGLMACDNGGKSADYTEINDSIENLQQLFSTLEDRIDVLENGGVDVSVNGEGVVATPQGIPRSGVIVIGEDLEAGVYNINTATDWWEDFLLFRSVEEFDIYDSENDDYLNHNHRVDGAIGLSGFILREGYIIDTYGSSLYFEAEASTNGEVE